MCVGVVPQQPPTSGHPGAGEPGQVAGEVAAVDGELERARPGPAWLPGVRLGADRHRRVADQVLGHGEHPLRADGAVGAEHRHRQAGQHGGDLARRLAAQGVRVVGEGGLGDERQLVTVGATADRLDQLVEVAERLQDEQVGRPIGDEGQDLLADHLGALGRADPAALGCGDGGRDRPGHQDPRSHRSGAARAIRTPARLISSTLSGKPWSAEPEPVRAERVGLDDVCARDR
jgi:hypothetical protein